jgi:hypothetical protein
LAPVADQTHRTDRIRGDRQNDIAAAERDLCTRVYTCTGPTMNPVMNPVMSPLPNLPDIEPS